MLVPVVSGRHFLPAVCTEVALVSEPVDPQVVGAPEGLKAQVTHASGPFAGAVVVFSFCGGAMCWLVAEFVACLA